MSHVGLSSEQQNINRAAGAKANSDLDRLYTLSSEQAEKISFSNNAWRIEVLDRARAAFSDVDGLEQVISEVEVVLACCQRLQGQVNVYVDMTEAHGYRYHSGVVFALYAKELGAAVAKGGRYDGVGEVFGERPATGFAIDLKAWSTSCTRDGKQGLVSSPVDASAQLAAKSLNFAPLVP